MPRCIWLRQDLRVKDNTALLVAADNNKTGLVALYVIAVETWQKHNWSAAKIDFIFRQLAILQTDLEKLNIPLKILQTKNFAAIPEHLQNFCKQNDISDVYVNSELLVDEIDRDAAVANALAKIEVELHSFDSATILHPELCLKKDGTPFKVYTPYKRNWLSIVTPNSYLVDGAKPSKQKFLKIKADKIPTSINGLNLEVGDVIKDTWPAGENIAKKRMHEFLDLICDYKKDRNFPSLNATSRLSPYLANGIITPQQCFTAICDHFAKQNIQQTMHSQGVACWVEELIWREFYYTIAYAFPQVVKHKPFKPETIQLPWSKSKSNFAAWCEGRTGFPLVDAAMRQLVQTGWMHNRLRMVVAMFLTKTLFINWRWGEDFFMQHLIDADFASNNGGWQWAASTGTDAVPYFRIFNPTTQSERFDAAGKFIREFCPELSDCTDKEIHNPSSARRKELGYPDPVVDYKIMRAKVIAEFKKLNQGS